MAAANEFRATSLIVVGFACTILAVVALQWFAPTPTVVRITDRYLCDGIASVDEQAPARYGFLREVECSRGLQSEDMTGLALLALFIPCAVVGAAAVAVGHRAATRRDRARGGIRTLHT